MNKLDPMFTKKKGKRGLASMPKAQQEEIREKARQSSLKLQRRIREDNMKRAERLGNYNRDDFYRDAQELGNAMASRASDDQTLANAYVMVQNVIDYAQSTKELLDVFKQTK